MLEEIDVSHHNGKIDWTAVAASRKTFMFAKCSEGSKFNDKEFRKSVAEQRKLDL